MIVTDMRMINPLKLWREVASMMAGFLTALLLPSLNYYWISFGFHVGIHEPIARSLGSSVGRYYLYAVDLVPLFAVALAAGALIAFLAPRRAVRLALLFAVMAVLSPLLLWVRIWVFRELLTIAVFPVPIVTAWLITRVRSRRPRAGDCQKCGYDLTGNISGVCPECGCAVESLEKGECL